MEGLPVLSLKKQAQRVEALKMSSYWNMIYWKERIMQLEPDEYEIYQDFLDDFTWLKFGFDESLREYRFYKSLQLLLSL